MAKSKWLNKYLTMKPEVTKIFEDLEQYREYCASYMLKFDEKDLYRSEIYRKFDKQRNWQRRQQQNQ
jgi:hypothetical protein